MQNNLTNRILSIVLPKYWRIIEPEDVHCYLTEGLSDLQEIEIIATYSREEKAASRGDKAEKVASPTISEVLPKILKKLKKLSITSESEQRMILLATTEELPTCDEILTLEQDISKIIGCAPLVFTSNGKAYQNANIHAIMTTGTKSSTSSGLRIAYDLDDTVTRWPKEFSDISQLNREQGGFNLVISTRHEPSGSSCFKTAREKERITIEETGIAKHRLMHAWFDFTLWKQLVPFFDRYHWFDRFIWNKAFYCRLFRIDLFYEDQQRNIDRLAFIAPDIHVIKVSEKTPPVIPNELKFNSGNSRGHS